MAIQKSFLSQLNFKFSINKLPNTMLNITRVSLPSIAVEDIELATPFNKALHFPDKVSWGDLGITFKVDENLKSYIEIYNWMIDIGRAQELGNTNHNRILNDTYQNWYSDATLTIMSSAQRPIVEFRFKDIFPFQISDLDFSSTDQDVQYLDSTVQFRLQSFTIHNI